MTDPAEHDASLTTVDDVDGQLGNSVTAARVVRKRKHLPWRPVLRLTHS